MGKEMSREEAIKMIEDDIRLHGKYLSTDYKKALRMAVDALKREPCEGEKGDN